MATTENVQVPAQAEAGHRVYIGNLSYSTTEEKVREHLASAGGKISSLVLPLKYGKRPGGYGFADYETEEDAKAVIEKLNGSELDGRKIRLDPARSQEEQDKRRAENNEKRDAARAARSAERAEKAAAAGDTTAVTEGEAVENADGEKKKRRPSKKRAPRRRQPEEEGEEGTTAAEGGEAAPAEGDASAAKPKRRVRKPKEPKEAKEARIDGEDAEGATEKPARRERKPREKRMEPTGELSKTTIFVANLPFEVDDNALSAIFTNLSINVKSAKVATRLRRFKDKEQKPVRSSRGYGFVEVEDPAQQKEAVEKVEGTLVGDRQISAKIANEMKPIEKAEAQEAAKETAEATAAA